MYIRKSQNWELWGSTHPAAIGCVHEGRDMCTCKYHLVDSKRETIYSFDDWKEAEKKFCALSGAKPLQVANAGSLTSQL